MKRSVRFALLAILSLQIGASANDRPLTAQAERGRELFLKTPKGTACATCHSLAGVGTAVGPDLRTLAAAVGPRPLVMTIKMTVTAYVQDVETSEGNFPGLQKAKQGDQIDIWDLSQTPPVLRNLKASQVTSMKQSQTWKHPPAAAGYTSQELADIVGFLKWAATGSQTEIKPSDVE
jgi:mono/diheme cytochrome c family protein